MAKLSPANAIKRTVENVFGAAKMLQNERLYIDSQAVMNPDAARELDQLASDLFDLVEVMINDEKERLGICGSRT